MTQPAHIELRALEPEDLELIYRLENDPATWAWGTTNVPYSRYAIRQYLESTQNDLFADRQVRLVAMADEPIGLADLFNFDPTHLRAEIGLLIAPEHRGQGYARPILEQLEQYAVRLRLHQLYAITAVDHAPAARLFTHANYRTSACLHDWLLSDGRWVDATVWQKTFL